MNIRETITFATMFQSMLEAIAAPIHFSRHRTDYSSAAAEQSTLPLPRRCITN